MYGYKKKIDADYEEAVEKAREALKEEGFGVLTEIDVKATLKKKLEVDFENYIILGACNPPFAHKALQAEHDIGLLLPCNVIVHEKEGETYISAMLPTVAMQIIDNPKLQRIASEVEERLKRAVDSAVSS